ncbi:MAG: NAD(P)H-hydrate epimerase [Balneolaceae bacterium]|nr:NAD(P)H-hydrate epimerase [Balneolaceae bacterium]
MTDTFKPPHPYFVCTAAEAQQMDKDTIEEFGIDGYTLMEVAGSSAAKHLLDSIGDHTHGLYLCGKGNNAGDALVVARYLIQHGHHVEILFISGTDDLSADTQKNLELLQKIRDQDSTAGNLQILESWGDFDANASHTFHYIIDGMLGTGLDSDLRGDYTSAVEWANSSGLPIYAIDIPTGLHGDTGQIMGNAIRAVRT